MIVRDDVRKISVADKYWSLVEHIFQRLDIPVDNLVVPQIKKITSELDAWGVNWKWI